MKFPRSGSSLPIGKSLYSHAILIDTSILLALANPQTNKDDETIECLDKIRNRHLPIFVSVATILESHRRFLFDFGRMAAARFIENIYDGSVNIIRLIEEDEHEAKRLLSRYEGLGMTISDAVNMAVMTRLGIAVSFSYDRHFLQAGFIRIPPFHL
jgi:predicted nucleic acid-binding protein